MLPLYVYCKCSGIPKNPKIIIRMIQTTEKYNGSYFQAFNSEVNYNLTDFEGTDQYNYKLKVTSFSIKKTK